MGAQKTPYTSTHKAMTFSTRQVSPDKWGIYSGSRLLATTESEVICETILANLSSGRRDSPAGDVDALYQVPVFRNLGKDPEAVSSQGGSANASLNDQQLANELSAQQLKVNELEAAVRKVQNKQLSVSS